MRSVLLSIAIVLIGLVALLALEDGEPAAERAPAPRSADVATIAARVEALRGHRFDERPVPQRVSQAQARREGLEDFDRTYPEARREADEAVLELLGLIEPDVDLRAISASVFGEGVAGYYDPRSKRLRIVEGAAPDALGEMVLAHELTHALEDQRFGLDLAEGESDDAALARLALVEGSAMVVMQDYLLRHIGAEQALGGLLGSAFQTGPDLPPFLEAQLLFPYLGGLQFVTDLKRRGSASWTLVDLAERERVPDSTEQILHPEKWIAVETPLRVRVSPASLGRGWSRVTGGTWGEWATRELLGQGSDAAAAGWGGDRYELWRRGASEVLVMKWRWDSEDDAREFETALRGSSVARSDGGAVAARGDTVTFVLAPSAALARRVAAGA